MFLHYLPTLDAFHTTFTDLQQHRLSHPTHHRLPDNKAHRCTLSPSIMSPQTKPFTPLLPPNKTRARAAFFGKAGIQNMIRDQLTLSTWLCVGAAAQGLLFLAIGRIALLPAFALLAYRTFIAYAMSTGWMRNTYMDDIILKKFSAQFPDEEGKFNGRPASSDVVVLLIGMRVNHPLGMFTPGMKDFGGFFEGMAEDLEKHGEEFGYLGMTSWTSNGARETKNEMLNVGYFRTTEGLQAFARSKYHVDG